MGRYVKMKFDFIEIGTSNFDTLIQKADSATVGISVEPIKYYLNSLPDKLNVKKLNCAISTTNKREFVEVFYVPEKVVKQYKLPHFLSGCNSINGFHFQHNTLGVQHLVKKEKVLSISVSELFNNYDVEELEFLQVDTEGQDTKIMVCLYDFLINEPKTRYPKKILFESNTLSKEEEVKKVINMFKTLGYETVYSNHDTLLNLKKDK